MGGVDIRRHGRILWAALSIILIAGIVASLLIADSARKREESAAVVDAATLAERELLPLLQPSDLAGPVTGARYDTLLSDLQRDVLSGPAKELTLWDPDGTVLFSTDKDAIGTRPEDGRDAVRRAVKAGAHGGAEGTLFRSWVPLRLKESGPVVAVAELGRPYAPIWTAANRPWRLAAIAMGTGLLASVALLLVSFRGSVSRPKLKQTPTPKPEQAPARGDDWVPQPQQQERKGHSKKGGGDPAYTNPGYREAVELKHVAEERARVAEEQYRALQDQFKRALEELRAAEERLKQSGGGEQAGGGSAHDPRVDEVLSRMEALQAQLREAEERATHAQARAQAAEAALAHAQSGGEKVVDDGAMRAELEQAQQREREALERLAAEEQRILQMEEGLRESADRVARAEAQLAEERERAAGAAAAGSDQLEAQLREAQERATVAEGRMREAEVLAAQAAERAAQVEAAAAEAEGRVRAAEERAARAENAVAAAEAQASQTENAFSVEAEGRVRAAEERAARAEDAIAAAEAQASQAREEVAQIQLDVQGQLAQTRAQAQEAQAEELQLAEARARDAEAQLQAVQARLEEATARVGELEAQPRTNGSDEEGALLQVELAKTHERLKTSSERLLEMEERARSAERELEQLRARSLSTPGDRAAALERALHGDGDPLPGEDRRAAAPFIEALTKDARASVNSILGLALTAKHTREQEELQPLLRQLTSQARKLDHLVADILEADRLAKGTVPLNRRRTDLDALVRRVIDESGIETERDVRIHSERVSASVDPLRVEQIVSSLLGNSMARTTSGTSIYVRVERTDDGAMIAVEDDQASPDVSLSPIVTQFTDLLGGRAEVSSRLDGGSSFRIYLPNPDERKDDVQEDQGAAVPNGEASSNGRGDSVELAVGDVGSTLPQD